MLKKILATRVMTPGDEVQLYDYKKPREVLVNPSEVEAIVTDCHPLFGDTLNAVVMLKSGNAIVSAQNVADTLAALGLDKDPIEEAGRALNARLAAQRRTR